MQKRIRSLTALGVALLLAVPLGCSGTEPVAPPPPQASLIGDLVGTVGDVVEGSVTVVTEGVLRPVLGLLSCPASQTYSESRWIGPFGGTLRVGPHTLTVPAGALKSYERISATAPRGNYAEVRFEPHGLKFAKPVYLTMSYEDCGLLRSAPAPRIVYTDENRNILETFVSLPDFWRKTVTAKTDHFSGYILAE